MASRMRARATSVRAPRAPPSKSDQSSERPASQLPRSTSRIGSPPSSQPLAMKLTRGRLVRLAARIPSWAISIDRAAVPSSSRPASARSMEGSTMGGIGQVSGTGLTSTGSSGAAPTRRRSPSRARRRAFPARITASSAWLRRTSRESASEASPAPSRSRRRAASSSRSVQTSELWASSRRACASWTASQALTAAAPSSRSAMALWRTATWLASSAERWAAERWPPS